MFGLDLRRGDLSLCKTIALRDAVRVELRAECFNFTNTPNFAAPNRTLASYATNANAAAGGSLATKAGGFGSITNTVFGYSTREFQFAARFNF